MGQSQKEKQLQELKEENENLDKKINDTKDQFKELAESRDFKEYGYVTFEDIKSLTNGEDINLIAIKAPPGTSLEIPEPEHTKQIYNQAVKVKLYLINFLFKGHGRRKRRKRPITFRFFV
jgi:hypothetical protein